MTRLPRFLLKRAERTLNAFLQRDPATPKRLEALQGHTLELHLSAPVCRIALTATASGIRIVTTPAPSAADVTVTFSPAALGALLGGADIDTVAMQGALHIEGDTTLLQSFRYLLSKLDPDMEGLLAQLLGQLPAHALMHQLRRQRTQGQDTWAHLRMNSADYVTEEARILVGHRQMHVIYDQLDDLSRQMERDEMRLAHLEQRFSVHTALAHDKKEPLA